MKAKLHAILIVLAIFVGVHQAAGQTSFAPATNFSTNTALAYVAAGDVNGDGAVDLIYANYANGGLVIFTNNGNGVFGSNATIATPTALSSVATADVNGDGKVDIIAASSAGYGRLSVYTNTGDGHFVFSKSYPNFGFIVIAADVNGDGKVDLISTSVTSGSLVVLTNDGTGNFAVASYPGFASFYVAAADVNGDGKIDLIETINNMFSVLTNNGDGTFTLSSTNAATTPSPGIPTAADVNGDGWVDVIVPDYGSSSGTTLTVLTNNGSGILISNATYTVSKGPHSVIAADVNGDGKVDLISVGLFNTVTVLTNDGMGGFVSNATYTVGVGMPSYEDVSMSIIAADVNGDGKLDLITAPDPTVLINTSIFPPPTSTPPLKINALGKGVLASWPSVSAGWSLQQNSDLTKTNWFPAGYNGYPITDDGTNKSLVAVSSTGNLFFRLMHP